jgi:hypothetical protein
MVRKAALKFLEDEGPPGAAVLANLAAAAEDQEIVNPAFIAEIRVALDTFGGRVDSARMRGSGVQPFNACVWALRDAGAIEPLKHIRSPKNARWLVKLVEWDRMGQVFPGAADTFAKEPSAKLGGLMQIARRIEHDINAEMTGVFGSTAGYSFCQLTHRPLQDGDLHQVRARLAGLGPETFSAKIGMDFPEHTALFLVQVEIGHSPPAFARPTILADPACTWFKHSRDRDCADRLGRTADLSRDFQDGVMEALAARFDFGRKSGLPARVDALGFYRTAALPPPSLDALSRRLLAHVGGIAKARMLLEKL